LLCPWDAFAIEISEGNSFINEWYYFKSITTFVRGSCRLKFNFKTRGSHIYGGEYRLIRNGSLIGTYTLTTLSPTHDIQLDNNGVSKIDIEARYSIGAGRPTLGFGIGIERFELWVRDNPGMLAMLG
jgi:hypothetical protein